MCHLRVNMNIQSDFEKEEEGLMSISIHTAAQLLNMVPLKKHLDNTRPMHTSKHIKFDNGKALVTSPLKARGGS